MAGLVAALGCGLLRRTSSWRASQCSTPAKPAGIGQPRSTCSRLIAAISCESRDSDESPFSSDPLAPSFRTSLALFVKELSLAAAKAFLAEQIRGPRAGRS